MSARLGQAQRIASKSERAGPSTASRRGQRLQKSVYGSTRMCRLTSNGVLLSQDFLEDQQRDRENFTDLTLLCCDGYIDVHRSLLMGPSKFLRELLIEMDINNTEAISMPDISVNDLGQVLQLLYYGETSPLYSSDTTKIFGIINMLGLSLFYENGSTSNKQGKSIGNQEKMKNPDNDAAKVDAKDEEGAKNEMVENQKQEELRAEEDLGELENEKPDNKWRVTLEELIGDVEYKSNGLLELEEYHAEADHISSDDEEACVDANSDRDADLESLVDDDSVKDQSQPSQAEKSEDASEPAVASTSASGTESFTIEAVRNELQENLTLTLQKTEAKPKSAQTKRKAASSSTAGRGDKKMALRSADPVKMKTRSGGKSSGSGTGATTKKKTARKSSAEKIVRNKSKN